MNLVNNHPGQQNTSSLENGQDLEQTVNDETLSRLAKKINSFGLGEFGVFLIEAHLPLSTLLNTFATMGAPILAPAIGVGRYSSFQEIISEKKNIEKLSAFIEADLKERSS